MPAASIRSRCPCLPLPRSMLTVFRCSFGDCSTPSGTPILELTSMSFAATFGITLVIFVSTFGLFNIAAAIFLERTMEYASERTATRQHHRLEDDDLWVESASNLLKKIKHHVQKKEAKKEEEAIVGTNSRNLRNLQFSREDLDTVVKRDDVKQILEQLDIDPQDSKHLADIADMDNSGTMGPSELILAVRRLRGRARHGEIVKVDLMVRALQTKIDDVWAWTQASALSTVSCGSYTCAMPQFISTSHNDMMSQQRAPSENGRQGADHVRQAWLQAQLDQQLEQPEQPEQPQHTAVRSGESAPCFGLMGP